MKLVVVPDEESEDIEDRSTDRLIAEGLRGGLRDHRRADRPPHRGPGERGPGPARRSRAAPRPTAPRRGWGTTRSSRLTTSSAASRRCRSADELRPLRPAVDQPRPDPGRRRLQQGPRPLLDRRRHPLPARTGPGGDPRADPRARRRRGAQGASPARPRSSRGRTRSCWRCATACRRSVEGEALSVGRDGASDAISFLEAGIPAVEFGPDGGGHHGPEEWVSISSLAAYRQALGDFVRALPAWLERREDGPVAHRGGRAR